MCVCVSEIERQTDRAKQRHTETETERDRDRERQRQRQGDYVEISSRSGHRHTSAQYYQCFLDSLPWLESMALYLLPVNPHLSKQSHVLCATLQRIVKFPVLVLIFSFQRLTNFLFDEIDLLWLIWAASLSPCA